MNRTTQTLEASSPSKAEIAINDKVAMNKNAPADKPAAQEKVLYPLCRTTSLRESVTVFGAVVAQGHGQP